MKKIKNRNDLLEEKLRLQLELSKAEAVLKEDMEWLNEEIKPLRSAGEFIKNMFYRKSGIVNEGVRFGMDAIMRNFLLAKSGWVTKLIVPFLVRGVSTGILKEKRPEIFNFLRSVIRKARKSTTEDRKHYDRSAVDDVDY